MGSPAGVWFGFEILRVCKRNMAELRENTWPDLVSHFPSGSTFRVRLMGIRLKRPSLFAYWDWGILVWALFC